MTCPFLLRANSLALGATSPLLKDQEFASVDWATAKDREHEMFDTVIGEDQKLAVSLTQWKPIQTDKATRETIKNWR